VLGVVQARAGRVEADLEDDPGGVHRFQHLPPAPAAEDHGVGQHSDRNPDGGVGHDLVRFGVQEGFPAGHEKLLPAKGGELLHRGGGEVGGHAARVGLGGGLGAAIGAGQVAVEVWSKPQSGAQLGRGRRAQDVGEPVRAGCRARRARPAATHQQLPRPVSPGQRPAHDQPVAPRPAGRPGPTSLGSAAAADRPRCGAPRWSGSAAARCRRLGRRRRARRSESAASVYSRQKEREAAPSASRPTKVAPPTIVAPSMRCSSVMRASWRMGCTRGTCHTRDPLDGTKPGCPAGLPDRSRSDGSRCLAGVGRSRGRASGAARRTRGSPRPEGRAARRHAHRRTGRGSVTNRCPCAQCRRSGNCTIRTPGIRAHRPSEKAGHEHHSQQEAGAAPVSPERDRSEAPADHDR